MKSTAFFLIVTLVCLPEVTQAFIRKTRAFKSYNFARLPYKRAGSPFEDGVVVSSPANLQQIQQLNGRGSGDITVKDMAEVLVNNPEIIPDFVITYMDKDGDGRISARELLASQGR
ncbi:uncharacterized protein [Littorina saxatilis]|uniref:uncharacterized protein isoform X2 n=1 Tax=Littorina saxatilis TaxID=31220 RepID=UPI0038B4EB28